MPNIDDILNDLGVQEETGSLEKQAQLVSNSDSEPSQPQLQDFYEQHWEPASQEKIASYQEDNMSTELDMEKVGSYARDFFQHITDDRLQEFASIKEAQGEITPNNMPDAEASMESNNAEAVMPGPTTNPQLPVNNPQTPGAIDTAPTHYELEEKNKAADKLVNALATGQVGDIAGGVVAQADEVEADDNEKIAAYNTLINYLY